MLPPMSPGYRVEPLSAAKHRREEFTCESPELTEFLRTRARKEMEARASACFVLVLGEDPGRIAGYYTLSAAEVVTAELPEALAKKLPRYRSLPATLLGRLARDAAFRGQGIGDLLMVDALARAYAGSAEIGSVAVVTDPKNERAAAFYAEFGFVRLNDRRMVLPMKDVERLWRTPPA
jgi:GNAT superfamily N-acetyltransferase